MVKVSSAAAYPRSRGATGMQAQAATDLIGLSPLARGNHYVA